MLNDILESKEIEIAKLIERYAEEEKDMEHIPQPIILVGSSGTGKTTIINLLASLFENKGMSNRFHVFDGKRFFCSKDIVLAIEKSIPDGSLLTDDNNFQRRIAIIDNLDYYFKRSSFDDQYRLRSYLNRESAPLLIATIEVIGNSLADYRAPFFEGIRLIYVPAFEVSLLKRMNLSDDKRARIASLMTYMPPTVRSFKIASDVVSASDSMASDMTELLNRVNPSYRILLERLPVNSQKILIALANSEQPASLSELRILTGMQAGILSSYLRQLAKSGIIRKTDPCQHGAPYEVLDRLFRLWLSSHV